MQLLRCFYMQMQLIEQMKSSDLMFLGCVHTANLLAQF